MKIHVVKAGDSLYSIANEYNVPLQEVLQVNKLQNANNLVIGQTILVPTAGFYHIVKPGDTLYTISQQYNVPIDVIARSNRIFSPTELEIGDSIYIPTINKRSAEVAAYIDPAITGEDSAKIVADVAEYLTYVNIFSYHVNPDGTLTPLMGDESIINAAYSKNAVPLMVITNFTEGQFSRELATQILSNEELQNKLLDEAIDIMIEKGYLGIDFDFEYLGAENRQTYVEFLRKARARLDEVGENYILSAALAPKLTATQMGVLYEGHDYKAIGEVVDFIFFMTYEWGWSGGPPMAVSPIDQVRKVMEYAVSVVPPEKIMMGMPLYGYDWTLPYVKGGKFAKSIGFQRAIELALQYNKQIQFDEEAMTPFFTYTDEMGREHEVWFEDARSIQAKMNLVKEFGFRGFFYWVLGREAPQNWALVKDNFNVVKLV